MEEVDVVVIGSGQGGVPFATEMAGRGKDVVLFERDSWGGSCLNYGCTPSKMFLASAHAATRARRADELGVHAEVRVDFTRVMARIRDLTSSWSKGNRQRLESSGVRTIEAEATFTDIRTVTGGDLTVQAPLVVLNTGKSPFVPDIPGLQGTPYMTYVNFWEMTELPERTLVMGAGYVGMELGQGLARLGSHVDFIDISERPVSREEEDVSEVLRQAFVEDGASFHLGTRVERVQHADGLFTLTLDSGETLEGEALLVATGRKPNTTALDPEAGDIELDDNGHIVVDSRFRTSCDGVYAIGDVTGQPAFTHVSWEDYRRLVSILDDGTREARDRVLGYAFFTDPQVGRAGKTQEEATSQGYAARAVTLELDQVARATETGREHGFYRMVIDEETDEILGATLVGPQTAELIHVFIAHMEAGSTWQLLDRSVHIHPTFAEGLPTLARKLED